MYLVRIVINVILLIIANAVLRVDGQSKTKDFDSSNDLSIPAPDPFDQDSAVPPDYKVAALDPSNLDSTIHSDYNVVSGDSLKPMNLDLSSGTGDLSNCPANLGKREDSDFTLADEACAAPSSQGNGKTPIILNVPNDLQRFRIPTPGEVLDRVDDWVRKQQQLVPALWGPLLPKKPKCKETKDIYGNKIEELVCCKYEIGIGRVAYCDYWRLRASWLCKYGVYCCLVVYRSTYRDETEPIHKVFKTLFGSICRKMEPIEKNTSDNDNEDVNANW